MLLVARSGSAGGWPFLGSALARFGRPRPQARPPGRHGAPVRGVLLAVARAQRRLFVAPHERGDDEPERGRVREQERASENELLSHDCCADGEVHRIAHMAIQPADYKPLRRRRRCRGPTPLEDEAAERMQEDASAESDQSRAEYNDGSRRIRGPPASQQPRHETGHHAGRHEEEQDAAECGLRSAHATSVRPSAEPLHQPLLLARSATSRGAAQSHGKQERALGYLDLGTGTCNTP